MPFLLTNQSRREFIVTLGAGILVLPARAAAPASVDDGLVALLNDPHIGGADGAEATHLRHLDGAVKYLTRLERRPAVVLVNGDMANTGSLAEDYAAFAKLIEPLRLAGMPVHLTLGNRDDREMFYRVLATEKPGRPVVPARHVAVVATPLANFFLLDSLKKSMAAPGDLGAEQLRWLAEALDARADKPALVVMHHNPRLGVDRRSDRLGLEDTAALWDVLVPRRHVKACIHGHLHDWGLTQHEGIHVVNTPATSFVRDPKTATTGWTMARLREDGMSLTTLTHQPGHEWHNRSHELKWRA